MAIGFGPPVLACVVAQPVNNGTMRSMKALDKRIIDLRGERICIV
jgi:hypothetical protein